VSPRPLLVGQAPSRSCGMPWASDAGRRLARYMGVTHAELLATFEARNLNACHPGTAGKYDVFDLAEARETAARMWANVFPRRDLVLVCGVATARCFGLEAPSVRVLPGARGTVVVAVPHPAGTSMWWNDPANRAWGEALAQEAWARAMAS
jgi:uracil-DNA glycosylase